ncbi:MAG: hypothetical protein IJF53_09390 [Clostridia bacterium]|nr:hypothetical protein [Clostridia bacterium]
MKNKKGKRNFAKAVLVFMTTLCVFTGNVFINGEAFAASEFSSASPFSKVDYSTYYHNGRFTGNVIVNGVDVSYWQNKNCNWNSAKAAGVDYAILRVTYTGGINPTLSMDIDSKFETHYRQAKAAGVMTGAYVFSQAKNTTEAVKEANYAIKRLRALGIGPKDLELPVYMDYEFYGGKAGRLYGISKTAATNAAVAFCNTIKAAGYTPGIYASTSFYSSYITTSQLAPDVDIWCAQYYNRNTSSTNFTKWQYSSSAKIDGMLNLAGIKGSVDVNFWYLNKKNATSKVVTKITGKTTLSVADAKSPKFKLYNGNKLLKEGTDYVTGGIRNNATGNGYAYIKGIGSYGGYALIPIKVAKKTEGDENQEITCANYLTTASSELSQYLAVPTVTVNATDVKTLKGKKQKFYVKVEKMSKGTASGYQVKYSRNSDMSESVTKNIGTKYSKVSNNIKTNARKRYYYVQVRTYKDSGGLRYYSPWSKVYKVWVK